VLGSSLRLGVVLEGQRLGQGKVLDLGWVDALVRRVDQAHDRRDDDRKTQANPYEATVGALRRLATEEVRHQLLSCSQATFTWVNVNRCDLAGI
jgi:hypothetical protein